MASFRHFGWSPAIRSAHAVAAVGALAIGSFTIVSRAASGSASVEHWVSSDGVISFDVLADGTWKRMKDPPAPAEALWLFGDGQTRLIATSTPLAKPGPLDRAGLEEGTCHALPGSKVQSSRESTLGGFPIFTIVAEGDFEGKPYTLKQVVLPVGPTVYKIMAGGIGEVDQNASLNSVYQSLAIATLPAGVTPPAAPAVLSPLPNGAAHLDGQATSVLIAEMGIALLLVAGVIALVFRMARRSAGPPPLP